MVIYLAPLVAVLGAALYGFAGNPKASELGRIMFFAGLLATLLIFAGSAPHVRLL